MRETSHREKIHAVVPLAGLDIGGDLPSVQVEQDDTFGVGGGGQPPAVRGEGQGGDVLEPAERLRVGEVVAAKLDKGVDGCDRDQRASRVDGKVTECGVFGGDDHFGLGWPAEPPANQHGVSGDAERDASGPAHP